MNVNENYILQQVLCRQSGVAHSSMLKTASKH